MMSHAASHPLHRGWPFYIALISILVGIHWGGNLYVESAFFRGLIQLCLDIWISLGLFIFLWPLSFLFSNLGQMRLQAGIFPMLLLSLLGFCMLVPIAKWQHDDYRRAVANQLELDTKDYENTLKEIALQSAAYEHGPLPQDIETQLVYEAHSGSTDQLHQLTIVYRFDARVAAEIACNKLSSTEDLTLIFESYNNFGYYIPGYYSGYKRYGEYSVLRCLAQNPQTPGNVLAQMLKGADQEAVIRNPNVPNAARTQLLDRQSRGVYVDRLHAAQSPYSTPRILEKLASDPEGDVRVAVVKNPHTSAGVLQKMLKDDYFVVSEIAKDRLTHLNN